MLVGSQAKNSQRRSFSAFAVTTYSQELGELELKTYRQTNRQSESNSFSDMNLPFGTICQETLARARLTRQWIERWTWMEKVERKTLLMITFTFGHSHLSDILNKLSSIHRLQACNYKISSSLEESKCLHSKQRTSFLPSFVLINLSEANCQQKQSTGGRRRNNSSF